MVELPIDSRLKVEIQIEDHIIVQEQRPYLGISGIGANCLRSLWYGFRLCSQSHITSRLHRLFQRGHREEEIIREDLRRIGIYHHSDQKEVVAGRGHIKGHIDDLLENVPDAPKTTHLGEYKTHNDKSFKDLKNKGVKNSKPTHYAQMQCYMYLLNLKRALYIAVNKNDDSRYYERVRIDKDRAISLLDRAMSVISSEELPPRIGNPAWFECKMCNHLLVCHYGTSPLANCRTCKYVEIHDEGKWRCSGHKLWLPFSLQKTGCDKHKFLPSLVAEK